MLLDLAFDVMQADGDEACLALVRAGAGAVGIVELIEGALAPDEAIALAHNLAELGQRQEALDVLAAVIAAAAGTLRPSVWAPLGPQGDQQVTASGHGGWGLGSQAEA